MEARVRELLAELLETEPDAIPLEEPFADLGVDSLQGLELLVRIEQEYGVHVPEEELPSFPTPRSVVERVLKELEGGPRR